MLDIVKSFPICNGNGSGSIGGRGVLRRKLSRRQRVGLAADVALGLVRVAPSLKQAAATVGVRPDEIRAELKARAAADKAAAERPATSDTSVVITEVTSDVPTPPPSPSNGSMSFAAECIVYSWTDAELADQVTAIRDIGTDEVWNALVAAVSNQ